MAINLTLVGTMITFILFVVFTMRYVWPVIDQAIVERQGIIEKGLSDAAASEQQLVTAKKQAEEIIRSAKDQANEIILNSEQQANMIAEEARKAANLESEQIIKQGKIAAASEFTQIKQKLTSELMALTLTSLTKVLPKGFDIKVHEAQLNQVISELK